MEPWDFLTFDILGQFSERLTLSPEAFTSFVFDRRVAQECCESFGLITESC